MSFWTRICDSRTLPASIWGVFMVLMACWYGPGCKTSYIVIPADKQVIWVAPGRTVTLTNGGWVVPDARFKEILRKLNEPE
jgi:hypothetical protein